MSKNRSGIFNQSYNDELHKYSDLCSPYLLENLQYPGEKNKMQNSDELNESTEVTEYAPKKIRKNTILQEKPNKNNTVELKQKPEIKFQSSVKNDHFIAANYQKHLQKYPNYSMEHKNSLRSHGYKKQHTEICIHNHDAHFLYKRPIPPLNLKNDFHNSVPCLPITYFNSTVIPNLALQSCSYSKAPDQSGVNKVQDTQMKCHPSGTARLQIIEKTQQKPTTSEKENSMKKQKYFEFRRSSSSENQFSIHRNHSIPKKICKSIDVLNYNSLKMCNYNRSIQGHNWHSSCQERMFPGARPHREIYLPSVPPDQYINKRSPYFPQTNLFKNPHFVQ